MAVAGFDRVRATSTTTGTGNISLTAVPGFRTFVSEFSVGEVIPYCIEGRNLDETFNLEWEYGLGTIDGGGLLVRTTPTFSNLGIGVPSNFSAHHLVIACGFTQKGVEYLIEHSPLFIRNKQMIDATNYYVDGIDVTKRARLESGLIATGTDRTYSFPDATGIFVLNDNVATLTNKSIDCTTTQNTVTNIRDVNVAALAGIQVNKLAAMTADRVALTDASGFLTTGSITVSDIIDAASTSFADDVFEVYDNLTPTKKVMLQCSGITAATTRTLTIPDANGTIVLNDNAATLTNKTIDCDLNTVTDIRNANINAAAAIDWSKMAALAVDRIAIVNASADIATTTNMIYENASGAVAFGAASAVSTSRVTVNAIAAGNAAIFRNSTGASQIARFQDDLLVVLPQVTASRALATGASSQIVASATTATQLGYLSTTTSDVQVQLDGKLAETATADKMMVTSAAGAITTASLLNVNQANSLLGIGVAVSTTNRVLINGQTADSTTNAINIRDSAGTGIMSCRNDGLIFTPRLTSSRALVTGASSQLAISATTAAEIGFVSGVTSSIQTQLNGKLNTVLSPNNSFLSTSETGVVAPRAKVQSDSGNEYSLDCYGSLNKQKIQGWFSSAGTAVGMFSNGGTLNIGGGGGTINVAGVVSLINSGTPGTAANTASFWAGNRAAIANTRIFTTISEDGYVDTMDTEGILDATADADLVVNCRTVKYVRWNFSPTANRTLFFNNLDTGRRVSCNIYNNSASTRVVTLKAKAVAAGYVDPYLATDTGTSTLTISLPTLTSCYLEVICVIRDSIYRGFVVG
jgi:hypothetical protein